MKFDLSKEVDIKRAETYFSKLKEKGAKMEIKEHRAKRSLSQNAYFHIIFTIMSDHTGYTVEEMKVIVKREFGSFMVYKSGKHKFLRSTADLDTLEATQFIEWLINFSNQELGCYIMTPEEYLKNQFETDMRLGI